MFIITHQSYTKGRKMESNYEPVEHEPYDVEAAQAAEDREAEKYDIDKDWEY